MQYRLKIIKCTFPDGTKAACAIAETVQTDMVSCEVLNLWEMKTAPVLLI